MIVAFFATISHSFRKNQKDSHGPIMCPNFFLLAQVNTLLLLNILRTQRRSGTSQLTLTCQWRSIIGITYQRFRETLENMIGDLTYAFGISTSAVNRKFVRKSRIEPNTRYSASY